jgi:hypothetical protein
MDFGHLIPFGVLSTLLIVVALCGGWWFGTQQHRRNLAHKLDGLIVNVTGGAPGREPLWLGDLRSGSLATDRALELMSEEFETWRGRLDSVERAEPLLPFIAGAQPEIPSMVVQALFLTARKRVAKAHAAAKDSVRAYVRGEAIDSYLALWIDLVRGEGLAGVAAHRDRLAGIDEPGIDALLGADLALATYFEDDEATIALAGALASAVALVRDNLLKLGIVVDRPRLLCAADLASTGFRALLEPGDSTRTAWLSPARALLEADAFSKLDPETVVVAVKQFGFRQGGMLIRPTRLAGYEPSEWSGD